MSYTILTLIAFSIWMTTRINKRLERKSGCIGFGYVSLVIFCISGFAIAITLILFTYVGENLNTFINGDKYIATITNYTSTEKEDSEGDMRTYYTLIFSFTTNEGVEITKSSGNSSTGVPQIGEKIEVYYDVKNDKVFQPGAMVIIGTVGMLIMCVVLLFSFVGIIRFAFGYDMSGFWKICQKFGTIFFIPFIMIAFDALLIYALFHKKQPFWVEILLGFFILMLTLGCWGYIKSIVEKGPPKWKRTSETSWSADWEDEDEDEDEDNWDKEENNDTGESVNNTHRDYNKGETDNYNKKY
ncbi:hypothetical protein M2451_001706 [Dysgonomonas sp. PFB1-18]|uniref:DUF3592 domain-containing protein n=1 Tax=unclassified Dysgonomonas TaxID=2630389 RepID=UPI002475F15B|nr:MULTISPECIES: DUF3592 domain-containing protein [unclassified Dysgonomonas]MDH6309135.1 hypothetical protein [Dysgonomonas sp. PF1-14]MDH6338985.1 hypothetical protein [Dysgonomonas sp. PF1-16]MDH6380384.1 hypothetical protein [Dysgonomonas sp. PFB1-18]MDH6397813.1 hypothetical protein [Dysgonomonas sp. PF1-23]